ncbi:MAG: carboxypeptidase regulatory-like domain-containing protein [Terriglobales bacterium]
MRSKGFYSITLGLFLVIGCVAQEITADMRGTVYDPSGAVVSGANVHIINTDRNIIERKVTTGANGVYSAPVLPLGHYQIRVDAPGFAPFAANDIVLNLNDRRVYDIRLKVGSAEQNVTVISEAPQQVNLEDNTASGLMNGTQIRELSVLSRNFVQLVTLMPGVTQNIATDQFYAGASNPTGSSNQINIVVNGQRPSQNSWMIDGAEDLNRGSNLTLYAYPSIDSIAEFRVLRANFLPEHGRTSAGEVSVVTRGGTNNFHGSAYEFFRNDKLNANNYFINNVNKPRPPLRWNDWGFTIGGPIKKNNTFFFYSQEWRHFILYTPFTSSQLPTTAEMAGTFPLPVCVAYAYDATGTPGCTTTSTQVANINPVAAAYIKDIYSKIPAPNSNATTCQLCTLVSTGRNLYNYREEAVRIDHNFGSKLAVFGRYSDDSIPTQEPTGLYNGGYPVPAIATTLSNTPARMFAAHATATISPTIVNDGGYTYSWGGITSDAIGLASLTNSPDVKPTLPFATTSHVVPSLSFTTGQGISATGPYYSYDRDQTAFDTLTKTLGEHAFKFGGTFNHYDHNEAGPNYPSYSINNRSNCVTGSPANCTAADKTFEQNWANFLVGNVFSFSEAQQVLPYLFTENMVEAFGQDEWRIRPNLTLDYGLRWTIYGSPQSTNNLASTFDPALYDAAKAPAINPATGRYFTAVDPRTLPGYIQTGKNSPWGQALEPTNWKAFAPRFGFAWDPFSDGKNSIRGGFGLFYGTNSIDNQLYSQTTNPGVSPANAAFSNTSLSNPNSGTAGGTATTTTAPPFIYGPNPLGWKLPYTESFDLDVQHQFSSSTMLDIGYYGNLGRHLMGGVDVNMPQPLAFQSIPGYCAKYPGTPCYFRATDWRVLNYVRPYPGFDAINEWTSAFTSSYNGLQAQFRKQFSDSSEMVLNYTWSHDLTDASENFRGAENTYNLKRDWGNSVFDRRHVFSATYVYNLPFFKNQEGFIGHALGGWEVSGVFNVSTGIHYDFGTVSCNEDFVGLGTCGNTWAGDPPDQIADPNVGAPHTIAQWFNPVAFAYVGCTAANPKCTPANPPLRQGNAARGQIQGPGIFRWDASIFKNFKITERVDTQFRAEFFNATNHTNLAQGAPVTGLTTSLNSSSYDRILNARDPRNIQLALKVNF